MAHVGSEPIGRTATVSVPTPDRPARRRRQRALDNLDELVPRMNGVFRVGVFEHDPLEIADQIAKSAFDSSRLCKDVCIWGYWGNPGSVSVRLFRLDYGVLTVLQEITGSRTIGEIIRRLTAAAKPGDHTRGSPVFFRDCIPERSVSSDVAYLCDQ